MSSVGGDPEEVLIDAYEIIDDHESYDLGEDPEELAEEYSGSGSGEPHIEIEDPGSTLILSYQPHNERIAGRVPQSVDPGINPSYKPEGSFSDKLAQLHQQIGEEIDSEYTEHEDADSNRLVTVKIPITEYDSDQWESTVDEIASASQSLGEIHQELEAVVERNLQ